MGRPRKPLEQQTRHNTVSERLRRQQEEESVKGDADQLKKPPEWLCNTVAREEWQRVVKELEKIVIVGNLDVTNIGAYCNAYAAYRAATEELAKQPQIIEKSTKTGVQLVENPLIRVQKNYSDEMRKFAGLCGLTISSRMQAGASKVNEKEKVIYEMFGNI